MSKLVVVLGATGSQGGSVISTFVNKPGYRIRGVTRNADSARARDLASRGIEIVAANLDDEASLSRAFEVRCLVPA